MHFMFNLLTAVKVSRTNFTTLIPIHVFFYCMLYGTTNLTKSILQNQAILYISQYWNDQVTFSTVKRSWLTKNPEAFLNLMRSLILYFIAHEHNKITTHVLDSYIKMLFPPSIPSLIIQCLIDESVELFGQTVAYL